MAGVHGSESSVVLDVNPDMVQEDSINQLGDDGNHLNSKLYYRATTGDFHAFEQIDAGSLTKLVTRVDKNTILHICVTAATPYYRKKTARTESVDFVNKALAKCKELLWQQNKKDETILHIAARHVQHDIVGVLLTEDKEARRNGQAVNRTQRLLEMKNKVGDTALHEAVRYCHLQVVKILISEDRNYQYGQNNDGETPLYIAAEMGALYVVGEILKCESPAYQGPHGRTALHAAILCQNEEIVKLLLEKFRKLITRKADDSGWTPLHYAAQHGFASIVKLLLEEDKNAAYMADKKEEKTALHIAASKGKAKVVEEFMLACPDCFEQVDKNGQNVLHFAVEAKKNRDDTLRLILDDECFNNLINGKDKSGNTPLHHLASSDNPMALDLVFHPKLNARIFNKENLSPLGAIFARLSEASYSKVLTAVAFTLYVDKIGSRSIRDKDEGNEGGQIKDQDGMIKLREELEHLFYDQPRILNYLKDYNLLIGILIATVAFAAGFTIPGGYTSDNGPNQAGYPVLIRKPAFKVFVFSNAIAFVLASSGVFLHLCWTLYTKLSILASGMSLLCTLLAMIAMMVAFVSGTCVILTPYPSLVAAICVLTEFLFISAIYFQPLRVSYFFLKVGKKVRARHKLLSEKVGNKEGNDPVKTVRAN